MRTYKLEILLLSLIFLLAAGLRLAEPGLLQFDFDDGITCIYGVQMLDGDIRLAGLRTSLNFYNPPLFLYLVTLSLAVSRNPMFPAACVALANALAILFVWRSARKCWGPVAGLSAALFMATCPAAVLASRRIYAQDFAPIFSAAIFFFAIRLIVENRRRDIFWIVFLAFCLAQIHYSGAFLLAGLLLAWLWIRPPVSWRAALAGLGAACVPMIPFFMHLFQTRCDDIFQALQTIRSGGAGNPSGTFWHPWLYVFDLPWDADFRMYPGEFWSNVQAAIPGVKTIGFLWKIAAALFFLALAFRAFRQSDANCNIARLFLTWGLVPPTFYAVLRLAVIPSYFFILYPVPFLVAGWAVSRLWEGQKGAKFGKGLSIAIIAIVTVAQVSLLVLSAHNLNTKSSTAPYSLFRDQMAAFRYIAAEMEKAPAHTIRLTQNYQADEAGIGFHQVYLLHCARGFRDKGNPLAASAQEAQTVFRLIDSNAPMRYPETAQHLQGVLAQYPRRDFGSMRVYEKRGR